MPSTYIRNLFAWNNPYEWQHFNVSVGLSDKFMSYLKSDEQTPWILSWNGMPWSVWKFRAYGKEFEVTAPEGDETFATEKALSQLPFFNKPADFKLLKANYHLTVSQIWHRIAKNAHADGCPGVIFIDRIRKYHNGEYYAPIVSLNPCGEEPLPANGVCCLGAVNIYYCLKSDGTVDELVFSDAVRAGIIMLNKVVDVSTTGIQEIDDHVRSERRIGLGVTGWHDALIKNKLCYSSAEGRKFVEKWLTVLRDVSYRTSVELAKKEGAFAEFKYDGYSKSKFFESLPKEIQQDIKKYGIRNVTCNTIAPYGTTGTMWGTSTGLEPHFAMEYVRNSRVGTFKDGCFDYIEYVEKYGKKDLPKYFESSHDISWRDHLEMQNVFAKYIDASVSKTTNLPRSASISDVKKAYELSYDLGYIKSTTVYVDGSKQQILEGDHSLKFVQRPARIVRHGSPKRPTTLKCDIHRTTVKGTPWIVMVGLLDNQPYEIFAGKQKSVEIEDNVSSGEIIKTATQGGGTKYVLQAQGTKMNIKEVFENAEQAALTRQISMNLRHGTELQHVVQQLEKSEDSIVEFSKAVARVLKKYTAVRSGDKVSEKCISCGSTDFNVVFEESCKKLICILCGNTTSKCD